jgi:hypothetical protein
MLAFTLAFGKPRKATQEDSSSPIKYRQSSISQIMALGSFQLLIYRKFIDVCIYFQSINSFYIDVSRLILPTDLRRMLGVGSQIQLLVRVSQYVCEFPTHPVTLPTTNFLGFWTGP